MSIHKILHIVEIHIFPWQVPLLYLFPLLNCLVNQKTTTNWILAAHKLRTDIRVYDVLQKNPNLS
jgi:hypothetical protein